MTARGWLYVLFILAVLALAGKCHANEGVSTMKIEAKIIGATDTHATFRVIVNGVSCGLLTAAKEDAAELIVRITTDQRELIKEIMQDVRETFASLSK